jgi:hypothetical protein
MGVEFVKPGPLTRNMCQGVKTSLLEGQTPCSASDWTWISDILSTLELGLEIKVGLNLEMEQRGI